MPKTADIGQIVVGVRDENDFIDFLAFYDKKGDLLV